MTTPTPEEDLTATFEPLRSKLTRIAYRMLGSISEAEDVAQEAFLRWMGADRGTVREPEAYLRRIVTHLCLDQLKSARHRREIYVGPWLPEPIVAEPKDDLDDFTLPLMLALERLSPLERAAFLLHDVFDVGFDEIVEIIGRDVATCRQLASRARTHVRAARPRFSLSKEQGLEIAEAFFQASRSGDMQRLQELLASDVVAYTDGGGKVRAPTVPVVGQDSVLQLHAALAAIYREHSSRLMRHGLINGLPGFITVEVGDVLQTTALQIEDGKVAAIYVVRNPDKLHRLWSQ